MLVALLAVAAPVLTPPAAAAVARPQAGDEWYAPVAIERHPSLRVLSMKRLSPRLYEYQMATPYLDRPTGVRVLLPPSYAAQPTRRFPVLYLLHGGNGSYRDWTTDSPSQSDAERITAPPYSLSQGDAERITAPYSLITVMPNGDAAGWYTDWYNNGARGNPRYESYILGQLLPWVDVTLRTIPHRSGRAVAGLSMGGYGTVKFAARHPDLFVAAAAFSGAVDLEPVWGPGFSDYSSLQANGKPCEIWGCYATERVRMRGDNPVDLAGNLRGLRLILRTGNGMPGGPFNTNPDPVEATIWNANASLHQTLDALAIPHVWDDYGPGSHSWPYWNRDLQRTLPDLMRTFAQPPVPPSPFSFTAVEPTFEVYGYLVRMHRTVTEFATFSGVTPSGFALTGSGSAEVTTAPRYRPGARYRVRYEQGHSISSQVVQADSAGRLRLSVALGPSNTVQQDRPGADVVRQTYTTTVEIQAWTRS
jgi:S-formylglutathione hydrolase FrmB